LDVHHNFCDALPMINDPKGSKLILKINKPPILDPGIFKKEKESSFKEKKPKVKNAKSKQEPKKEVEAEVARVLDEGDDLLEVSDDDSVGSVNNKMLSKSLGDLDLGLGGQSPTQNAMSKSFSSFGRPPAYLPREDEFTKEEVDLRHAEQIHREYGWEAPDWINSPLKPTKHGQLLKTKGNLASPVTDIHILLEKGEIAWEKPEWISPKLRATEQGKRIKNADGGVLAEAPTL